LGAAAGHRFLASDRVGGRSLSSNGGHANIAVFGGEPCEIRGVVGEDKAPAEANRRCHDQGIDGELASGANGGKEVTGHASDPHTGCHDPRVPSAQFEVDGLIGASAPVELNEG
jgi:hypothetical protein